MPRRNGGAMHVVTTRRVYKDKVYETHLLRRTYREGGKVKNETLANLSHLPPAALEAIRQILRGEELVPASTAIRITRSLRHGDSAAVVGLARRLGLKELLGPACGERTIALGLIVAQVLVRSSKAAAIPWFADTTLGVDLGIADIDTDGAYRAMDWLLERKDAIEQALVRRHLAEDAVVCYDLSSSYVEGTKNELARFGYSRDGKRGTRQVEYGIVATRSGLPLAIEVLPGNTADPASFAAIVTAARERFGLRRVVFVGDRGLITQARIATLAATEGFGWITALGAPRIRALAGAGAIQPSLFDERDLAEITHPDYPGERLVVCRNPLLAAERARKREALLAATEADLAAIARAVEAGRLRNEGAIGLRVGRVLGRHTMAKHFAITIARGSFAYERKDAAIAEEAALDGLYVLRTCEPRERFSSGEVVATYKSLANVERDLRSLKSVDVHIRPIRHRLADRVRAHAFICLLAAHLVWHLRRAWAPLTFTDEAPPAHPNPVAPKRRSAEAAAKAAARKSCDGEHLRPFQGLLEHLATLTRNTCTLPSTDVTFERLSEPTPTQRRALELLDLGIPLRLT